MILTLEVVGQQAQDLGAGSRKVFKAIGGTLGRLPDNDWVFPDPYVSGRHALIRYVNGKYFIEDTSTNGVFINSPESRLSRGQPQQLRDGDLLYIDAYQIRVSIQKDPEAVDRDDPFAGLGLKNGGGPRLVPPPRRPTPAAAPPPPPPEDRTASLAVGRQNDSHLPNNRGDTESDDEDDDQGTEWFGMSEMLDQKQPPPRATAALPPPARSRPEPVKPAVSNAPRPITRRTPPVPPRAVSSPVAPPPTFAEDATGDGIDHLRTLLDAAGIEGLESNEQTAETLGTVLRIAMGGVMEALRTRERMKDDLRMRGTTFKAVDNNPLKFSANVDDAFHNLLVKHNPAYLQPSVAVEDAFRDVRDHQSAFLAAMRLAFESMLSQFDPGKLQDEFDRQMKGSILGVPAKLRYWDLYRDKYGELSKEAEAGFRALFGDAFARAYEEHLERLKGRPAG